MRARGVMAPRRIDWRVLVAGVLIAGLCASFWLGSRYPSLQGKASADPNEALSAPLGFERHFAEPPADQTLQHLAWTAVEWAVTNRQGMTFGLLLAAALLTIVPLLPAVRGGRFAGALQGMLVGTPLGVCVNCAAPVSQSMLLAGGRVEVALSTLFSSPTFNVVVIGMLLSIFPWYLAALKIVTGLAMTLLVSPWLAQCAQRPGWRRAPHRPRDLPGARLLKRVETLLGMPDLAATNESSPPPGLLASIGWVLWTYSRNLWRVAIVALPLMLLAGLFGAALVELLPWNVLAEWSRFEGPGVTLAVVVGITAFGVALPVPMAFDVIVCSVLLTAGVPVYVVAALLVTLGIYSVYAWSVLATTLSWRIASLAGAAVFVLGLLAAASAGILANLDDIRQARLAEELAGLPPPVGLPVNRLASQAELPVASKALAAARLVAAEGSSELWFAPFEAATPAVASSFTRLDGARLGFKRVPLPRPYLTMQPGPMHLGALAAGDVNGDGWPDIAVGTHAGVMLYVNTGGRFELQPIDFPAMRSWLIGVVSLVDLDGDGAPDLFFSAWKQGSHILWNRGGRFSADAHVQLPGSNETLVTSAAFADVDHDGRIDIVTGSTSFESWFFYPEPAVNHLWRNRGSGRFESEALPGPQGDTLSLLFVDLNRDGWLDLLVGNDFDEPDRIFLNERGVLRPLKRHDSPLPYSGTTTMSFDSGDIDNDGEPELYIGQISMASMNDLPKRLAAPVSGCSVFSDVADRARCDALARFQSAVTRSRDSWSLAPCQALADPIERRDCAVTAHHWQRVLVRLPASGAGKQAVADECARIPRDFAAMHDVCAAMAASPIDRNESYKRYPDELESRSRSNLLFRRQGEGFADVTEPWQAGYGGWTWNARFADLDNDGWQDLFIAQGTRLRLRNPSLVYYRNQGGKRFEEATQAAGFDDHTPTGASLFVDIDQDGDLDVITYPFQLTPVIWQNHAAAGKGLEVRLDDRRSANRQGIGARIAIRAADGRLQIRDIKASGGYASHDLPVAHFGLGDWPAAHVLEVRWPDGESTALKGSFQAGRYTVVRSP